MNTKKILDYCNRHLISLIDLGYVPVVRANKYNDMFMIYIMCYNPDGADYREIDFDDIKENFLPFVQYLRDNNKLSKFKDNKDIAIQYKPIMDYAELDLSREMFEVEELYDMNITNGISYVSIKVHFSTILI